MVQTALLRSYMYEELAVRADMEAASCYSTFAGKRSAVKIKSLFHPDAVQRESTLLLSVLRSC